MCNGTKMYHLAMPLGKIIDAKLKAQNKFKPSTEPIYAITAATYKGLSFYVFLNKTKSIQVVFNTSPIDASYVEFTHIVNLPKTKTMIYTQHALDRYNERVHSRKYDNYKDMMKRLVVNNPMNNSRITNNGHKIVMKIKEGFLSGSADDVHKILTMNTFFDKVEMEDNKLQQESRTYFDLLSSFPQDLQDKFNHLNNQRVTGKITQEEFKIKLNAIYAQLLDQRDLMEGQEMVQ